MNMQFWPKLMLFTATLLQGPLWCFAQTDSVALSLHHSFNIPESVDFSLDATGNAYLITGANVLEKYDATGKKRAHFSQNQLGNIQEVNTTNPLKIMVWYADFRNVVLLDRSLTQLGGVLNLVEKDFPEVRTIAPAADGNLWIMDEVAFKLRKISPEGTPVAESQSLNILLNQRLSIRQIVDNGNQVIAADTTHGLFIFDVFGQFHQQISAQNLQLPIAVEGNNVRWIDRTGILHQINLDFPAAEQTWRLPTVIQRASHRKLYNGGVVVMEAGVLFFYRG